MVIPVYMGESRTELTRVAQTVRSTHQFREPYAQGWMAASYKALKEPAIGCSSREDLLYRRNRPARHCLRLAAVYLVGDRDIV
jgi:hypothetical protein